MRVSIEHIEKKVGIIRRKTHHCVVCTVEFSEEEKQVIKQRKLGDYIVMRWPVNEVENDLKWCAEQGITENKLHIKDLLKRAPVHSFPIPTDAKEHEQELTDALKLLKGFIEGNKEIEEKVHAFEL